MAKINLGVHLVGDQIQIKMYSLTALKATDIISEIKFTLRWRHPSLQLFFDPQIAPFYLQPLTEPMYYGGYYHQTMIAINGTTFGWNIQAGEQIPICTFHYNSGVSQYIELAKSAWVIQQNLAYYFEINGLNATGTFYKSKEYLKKLLTTVEPVEDTGTVCHVTPGKIDIGIFNGDVTIRAGMLIPGTQVISGLTFTLRSTSPITVPMSKIAPYLLGPIGAPVLLNGYYYQTYGSVPMAAIATTIVMEGERVIGHISGDFQIVNNAWTEANNGNAYVELQGKDVTGRIYIK